MSWSCSPKASLAREKLCLTLPVPSFLFPATVGVSGVSKSKTSTIEVTAETEKEVMTLDDEETFGNFYKSVSPSALQDSGVVVTEEDLSQIQADTPKLVYNNHNNNELGDFSVPYWLKCTVYVTFCYQSCNNYCNFIIHTYFLLRSLVAWIKNDLCFVYLCLQAYLSRSRTQASSATNQKESGLQEPSAGSGCPQRHPPGLHRAEA